MEANYFLEHIKKELNDFGLSTNYTKPIKNGVFLLSLQDKIHKIDYYIIAYSKGFFTNKHNIQKEFEQRIQTAANSIKGSINYILCLIVPKSESEVILKASSKAGIGADCYNLFENYSLIGYKKYETRVLINKYKLRPTPQFNENTSIKANNTKAKPPSFSQVSKALHIKSFSGIRLVKILLAAFAGVVLGVIPFILIYLSKDEKIDMYLLTSGLILDKAVYSSEPDEKLLREFATKHPLNKRQYSWLLANDYTRYLVENPYLNPKIVSNLMNINDLNHKLHAAKNPQVSPTILDKLSKDKNPDVRRNVASNPSLSQKAIITLSRDQDHTVKSALLDNPNLDRAMLDSIEPNPNLASCENKHRIYKNPSLPAILINYNINNPDVCIRSGIAANTQLEVEIVYALAMDENPTVRNNAIRNSSLSGQYLDTLTQNIAKKKNNLHKQSELETVLCNPSQTRKNIIKYALTPDMMLKSLLCSESYLAIDRRAIFHDAKGLGGLNGFMKSVDEFIENDKVLSMHKQYTNALVIKHIMDLKPLINDMIVDNMLHPLDVTYFKINKKRGMQNLAPIENILITEASQNEIYKKCSPEENTADCHRFLDLITVVKDSYKKEATNVLSFYDEITDEIIQNIMLTFVKGYKPSLNNSHMQTGECDPPKLLHLDYSIFHTYCTKAKKVFIEIS